MGAVLEMPLDPVDIGVRPDFGALQGTEEPRTVVLTQMRQFGRETSNQPRVGRCHDIVEEVLHWTRATMKPNVRHHLVQPDVANEADKVGPERQEAQQPLAFWSECAALRG